MGSAQKKLEQVREAESTLDQVFKQPATTRVIHYSCEDFRERKNGTTPRITSIATCNLENGQCKSFSIQRAAEINSKKHEEISNHYDSLEKSMLDEFFDHIRQHQSSKWIHWNMRDSVFGFEAIEHRYRVLGGEPAIVPEAQRYDLPRLLRTIYGDKYVCNPKLHNLMKLNELTGLDFVAGEDEPILFNEGKYEKLQLSTLRKTKIIAELAKKAWANELRTESHWWSRFGLSARAYTERIYEHWLFKLAAIAVTGFALYRVFLAFTLP